MLLLGINTTVYADETPTPANTPTYRPLWSTSTPRPERIYDCPDGMPGGYLTVTPNPEWLLYCQGCLDENQYEWGENPLATATPVPPTPTATPVPINYTIQEDWDPFDFLAQDVWNDAEDQQLIRFGREKIQWNLDSNLYNLTLNYTGSFLLKAEGHHYPMSGSGSTTSGTIRLHFDNDNASYSKCTFREGSYVERVGSSYLDLSGTYIEIIGDNEDNSIIVASGVANQTFDFVIDYAMDCIFTRTSNSGGEYQFGIKNVGFYTADYSLVDVHLFWNEIYAEEPSGEPESYCDDINGGEEEQEEDPFGFMPTIGEATCFSIGGWSVPIGWLSIFFGEVPEEWTVPGIEFCFIPMIFGELNIFGIGISLDFIATAMAGVLLFRFLTRS